MPTAQQLVQQGFGGYAGWGDAEANADFNATGGSGKITSSGGSNSGSSNYAPSINIDDYIRTIQDTLPVPQEEYLKANPFYFDEQAARDVSTAEFSPYYDEMLQDYLGDIKLTSEKNKGDVTRILADLDKQKELFIQQNGTDFEKTIRGIKEGYSGKGLYFSGTNLRDQGEATATNTNKLEGYLNTYGNKTAQANAENNYTQTQLQTGAQQKTRDIGREKTASIYGGINTQKDEAIDQYLYGMNTYYKNPNWKSMLADTGNTTLQQGAKY